MVLYKLLLFVCILFSVAGQMLLKRSTKNGINFRKGKALRTLWKMYTNKYFVAGAALYAVGMVLFIMVLSHLELSFIYPIISMNFVLVALTSKIIFKERLSRTRWVSMLFITIGVTIITLS